MKKFLPVILALLFPLLASAQQFEGDWNGKLSVGVQKLTLVFHIYGNTCTLDSPDQGVKGIPAQLKRQTEDSIFIHIPSLMGSYMGKKEGIGISGKFTQRGISFPLTLAPGNVARNRPQTPKAPFHYDTQEVYFTNTADATVLAGTLTTPKACDAKTPVVLLVSGSGLQNRDEELFEHKPFAVIADYLANQGIASLRYDDRSVGKSTGSAVEATTEQFRQDAEAGITFLRKQGFKQVGVIGHSEGGTIAYLLAADRKADFIITLAGPTVSGKTILVEQNRLLLPTQGISEQVANDYVKVLDKVFDLLIQHADIPEKNKKIAELEKECGVKLPMGLTLNLVQVLQSQAWTDYFLGLDPSAQVKSMKCPAFLLNGDKDLQVPVSVNFGSLPPFKHKKSQYKVYPALNHLFQHCTTGTVAEYGEIEETISPEVLEDIAAFIQNIR